MKILTIISLIIFQSFQAYCQNDTIYLDNKFQPTKKEKHSYYRTIEKMPTGKYKIIDFHKDGTVQMTGYSDKPDTHHFIGDVIRYYRNGDTLSVCEHENYEGGWITFYNENSLKASSVWCKGSKKEGIANFYNKKGKIISTGTFKNDKRYSGKIPMVFGLMGINEYGFFEYEFGLHVKVYQYYDNNQLAIEGTLIPGKLKMASALFYRKNGEKIGKCLYKNEKPVEGKCLEFYDQIFYSRSPAKAKWLDRYKDGELIERESFLKNGQSIGKCTYQYNAPFNGKVKIGSRLFTYKNGKKEGEVTVYRYKSDDILRKYTIKDGEVYGKTTFHLKEKDKTYEGTFKEGDPYNGFVFDGRKLCNYKEGIKDGICFSFNGEKLLAETMYANGKKEGRQIYYGKDLENTIGFNKNDKPYDGNFFKNGRRIDYYENGVKLEEKKYWQDTFLLFSREILKDSLIIYYEKNGQERFRGIKRDNKPYTGTFVDFKSISNYLNGKLEGEKIVFDYYDKLKKIEHYKDGKLDGKSEFYDSGKLQYSCDYKDGKPFFGDTEDSKGNKVHYVNGKIEGKYSRRINGFKCTANYVAGKKEGECVCWSDFKKHLKIPVLVELSTKQKHRKLFFIGTYKNDLPEDGVFIKDSSVEEYKNGVKDGTSLSFIKNYMGTTLVLEQYRNDTLNGKSKYYLDKKPIEAIYQDGKIKEGFLVDKKVFRRNNEMIFPLYTNYQKTDTVLRYIRSNTRLIISKGKPINGFETRENNWLISDEYKNGKLIKTYHVDHPDTLSTTIYDGLSSITYDKNKNILRKTKYADDYSNGSTVFYHLNEPKDTIIFGKDEVKYGCLKKYAFKNDLLKEYKNFSFCKNDTATIFKVTMENQRILREFHEKKSFKIEWPKILTHLSIYDLLDESDILKIDYYDNESGSLLATYDAVSKKGIKIKQRENQYTVKVISGDETKSEVFGYDEMIKKLKEWKNSNSH